MPFGDELATGLGFLSNAPTPASAGLAAAAGIISAISGPAEQLGMNPYAEHWSLFEPGGCLWGAPLTDRDYTGGAAAPRPSLHPVYQAQEGPLGLLDSPKKAALRWLFWQRKSWSLPAKGTRVGMLELQLGDELRPKRGTVMRLSLLNALLAEYRLRQTEMADSSVPTFHYIDQRPWADAEIEYWNRSAPTLKLAEWRSLKGPRPDLSTMTFAQRHVYEKGLHARTRDYYDDVKAEHAQLLQDNAAWYRDEAARWLEWKKGLARDRQVAEQGAAIEQAIHDFVANSPDPDAALQAVANGDVRFALDDHAPSVWANGAARPATPGASVLGGASGSWVSTTADSDSSGVLVALAALLGLVLLIGAAE